MPVLEQAQKTQVEAAWRPFLQQAGDITALSAGEVFTRFNTWLTAQAAATPPNALARPVLDLITGNRDGVVAHVATLPKQVTPTQPGQNQSSNPGGIMGFLNNIGPLGWVLAALASLSAIWLGPAALLLGLGVLGISGWAGGSSGANQNQQQNTGNGQHGVPRAALGQVVQIQPRDIGGVTVTHAVAIGQESARRTLLGKVVGTDFMPSHELNIQGQMIPLIGAQPMPMSSGSVATTIPAWLQTQPVTSNGLPPAPPANVTGTNISAPQINPVVQAGSSDAQTMTIRGTSFIVRLPRVGGPARPWNAGNPDTYLDAITEDARRMVSHPSEQQQSVDLLVRSIRDRNQPFYDFMSTVARHDADLAQYQAQTRPQIMQALGIPTNNASFAALVGPPRFTERLQLSQPSGYAALAAETRQNLNITNEAWNAMDKVTQMARIEQSLSNRMIASSVTLARLTGQTEEHDRAGGWDWSGASGLNRLKGATFGLFGATFSTRIDNALELYFKGRPAERHGNTLIRDEAAAEREFRSTMETIASELSGSSGGQTSALLRQMTSAIVERRTAQLQWNGIQVTKKIWASQATRWLAQADAFRTQMTGYAALYAHGARANNDFTIIYESQSPILQTEYARARGAEIRQAQDASRAAMRQLVTGVRALNTTLLFDQTRTRYDDMVPLDIDRDIVSLPGWNDFVQTVPHHRTMDTAWRAYRHATSAAVPANTNAARATALSAFKTWLRVPANRTLVNTRMGTANNPQEQAFLDAVAAETPTPAQRPLAEQGAEAFREAVRPDMARGSLETWAVRYNAAVAAYRADRNSNAKKAELGVTRRQLADEIVSYMRNAETASNAAIRARDRHLTELANESSAPQPSDEELGPIRAAERRRRGEAGVRPELQGAEGFNIIVIDRRGGTPQEYLLKGVKKRDGKYIVTGWARMNADHHPGEMHWFGTGLIDIDRGIEINPASLNGMAAVMQRIAAPASVSRNNILWRGENALDMPNADAMALRVPASLPFGTGAAPSTPQLAA